MIFILILSSLAMPVSAAEPDIRAKSAILVDAKTGRVLFEKDADIKAYPASTTKIMTALLAVENLDPSTVLTASEAAINIDRDGSNMGLLNGEQLTVSQLLYGLMVCSANDAANVLAEAVSGDIDSFVAKMNECAVQLGMTNTNFVNAHGYHDVEHYTTARDLAILASAAMEHALFRTVVGTAIYEIPPTNKYEETRIISNNNALVNGFRDHRYAYSAATGIKTGSTSDAGSCLVSSAEKNGMSYFAVVLDAPSDAEGNYSFLDSIALFNYGFTQFSMQTVSTTGEIVAIPEVKWGRGADSVILSAKEPISLLLPKGYDKSKLTSEITTEERIAAPVKEGDILGRIVYYYDGAEVGNMDLVATENIGRSFFKMIFGSVFDFIFSIWVMGPLGLIVAVMILRSVLHARKRRKERERRRRQARQEFYRH